MYNDNYYSPLTTIETPQRRWVVLGASGGAGRRAEAGRPVARRNMFTEKQRRVPRKVYARTQNMSAGAMKAGVDRKTARRYLDHPQASPGPRRPHAWRTRPDPLASAWPRAEAILAEAPELEAKALLEHLMEAREPGLNAGHLRTFQRRTQPGFTPRCRGWAALSGLMSSVGAGTRAVAPG